MTSKYNFLGIPYGDVDISNDSDYTVHSSLDLTTNVQETLNNTFNFTITFTGGRDEDLMGKFIRHYINNKYNTFSLVVPQNDGAPLDEFNALLEKAKDNVVFDRGYSVQLGSFDTRRDELVLWSKSEEFLFPSGVFINIQRDRHRLIGNNKKLYITTGTKIEKVAVGDKATSYNDYPYRISVGVYPRILERIVTNFEPKDKAGNAKLKLSTDATANVIHSPRNNIINVTRGLIQTVRWSFLESVHSTQTSHFEDQ